MAVVRGLVTNLFGIRPNAVRVDVRGFRVVNERVAAHLEHIGEIFLQGLYLGTSASNIDLLCRRLDEIPNEFRGFAYEGAAMGLGISDIILLRRWRDCFQLLRNAAARHSYLIHVGIGWAIAAIPWTRCRAHKAIASLDPLLRWLAIDGYGFHHGYFHWKKYVAAGKQCRGLKGYERRAFDQGLGRSLWFVAGAEIEQIQQHIRSFPADRQGDLWSGVSLACTYAGGVDVGVIRQLRSAAGIHRAELSLGATFAAKARLQSESLTQHTEKACVVLCGVSAVRAAHVSDECLRLVAGVSSEARYEAWRQAVRYSFDCPAQDQQLSGRS